MEEKHQVDKIDDVILPGFRFHPTDEELVGFYLKRKIQQQALPIELIKQVDIYKYDPWDLPKLASTGEKEWYFYCPRDRKYRNSARPNRVTGAGFWKATGTDRPIYSSDATKCVGLKKSLVFYRGRAAKGIKTDWMMHEFRLPSISDSVHQKKHFDRSVPANDSWVICRIFKKTNSVAQRALCFSWGMASDTFSHQGGNNHNTIATSTLFSQDNNSCTTEVGSTHIPLFNNHALQHNWNPSFSSSLELPLYWLMSNATSSQTSLYLPLSTPNHSNNNSFMFPTHDISMMLKPPSVDVSSLLLNLAPAATGDNTKITNTNDCSGSPSQPQLGGFPISSLLDMQENPVGEQLCLTKGVQSSAQNSSESATQTSYFRSIGMPLSFPTSLAAPWKPTVSWETHSCPSEMSTGYSSNKCYS